MANGGYSGGELPKNHLLLDSHRLDNWWNNSCILAGIFNDPPSAPGYHTGTGSEDSANRWLHEDGLSDFFDGFGGGKTKTDILRIMKDSNVGSYALIGMILYYSLLISTLSSIPKGMMVVVLFAADPFSKLLTTGMMNLLPYARTESESKSKTLYDKLGTGRFMVACLFGLLPLLLLSDRRLWFAALLPLCVLLFLFFYVWKRIGGYTGDICGATALLCELGFYLAIVCLLNR